MTTEEADRLTAACALLGPDGAESRLLHNAITDVRLIAQATADTYEVEFEDGSRGAFKSIEGSARNAAAYGHTAVSVLLNDVGAWLVARGLRFRELVNGVVLRAVAPAGVGIGTLQSWHDGEPSGPGWQDSRWLRRAALFDGLIGQQDRNGTNFKYDEVGDQLGLFDNSFSFALPGHQTSASAIIEQARGDDPTLEDELVAALNNFATSSERELVERILPPDRWTRVLERHERMLQTGELLEPFDF